MAPAQLMVMANVQGRLAALSGGGIHEERVGGVICCVGVVLRLSWLLRWLVCGTKPPDSYLFDS